MAGFQAWHCVQHVGQWLLGAPTPCVVEGNHGEGPRWDSQQVLCSHSPRQSKARSWVQAFSLDLKLIVFSKMSLNFLSSFNILCSLHERDHREDLRHPDDVSLKDRNDNFVKLLASIQNDLCKEAFENIIDTKHKHNNIITGPW